MKDTGPFIVVAAAPVCAYLIRLVLAYALAFTVLLKTGDPKNIRHLVQFEHAMKVSTWRAPQPTYERPCSAHDPDDPSIDRIQPDRVTNEFSGAGESG
jgi:hypothetical protein